MTELACRGIIFYEDWLKKPVMKEVTGDYVWVRLEEQGCTSIEIEEVLLPEYLDEDPALCLPRHWQITGTGWTNGNCPN